MRISRQRQLTVFGEVDETQVVAEVEKSFTKARWERMNQERAWKKYLQNVFSISNIPRVNPKATAACRDWMKGLDLSGPSM